MWNSSMLFFQTMLLGGYAYAHGTSKLLSFKAQSILHIFLLIVCCIFLPLGLAEFWSEPDTTKNLIGWQLGLMLVSIGAPFFVLSGCAPMFQRWFSFSDHKDADNPYFLYGASNLGSMSALLCYPFIVEPLFTLGKQSFIWSSGYVGLIVMAIISAAIVFMSKSRKDKEAAQKNTKATKKDSAPPITNKQRAAWLFLAFIPSSLMLGVTTYITTDIASVPLLWIIPLAIYVGTFIIAFARNPLISNKNLMFLHLLAPAALIISKQAPQGNQLLINITAHLYIFAVTAQLCHSKLSSIKPHVSHLTEFYLLLSVGGVLGGIFNALIAPLIFVLPYEYHLILVVSLFARFIGETEPQTKGVIKSIIQQRFVLISTILGLGAIAILTTLFYSPLDSTLQPLTIAIQTICVLTLISAIFFTGHVRNALVLIFSCYLIFTNVTRLSAYGDIKYMERNYFGTNIVTFKEKENLTLYFHGTTLHGVQINDPKYKLTPVSYYYRSGNDVFKALQLQGPKPKRIAVTGLGAGVLACHSQPNWHFDFYEIDPIVKKIAENEELFTFLSDCTDSYDVILGDARLTMQKAEDDSYDMIFLDAFSSDSIPIHLVTQEAFDIYTKKLKENGLIVANISNRYLNLEPVLNTYAKNNDMHIRFLAHYSGNVEDSEFKYLASFFAVMARKNSTLDYFDKEELGWRGSERTLKRVWSDDFANIIDVVERIPVTTAIEE